MFSILTPLYNTPEDFLIEMLDSVLGQEYSEWELCLADGSDETHHRVGEISKAYAKRDSRICYQKLKQNRGIAENTNECFRMAKYPYLAILDHDDILDKKALQRVYETIQTESCDFVYTDEAKFRRNIRKRSNITRKPNFTMAELCVHNIICHFNVFERSLFEAVQGYRTGFEGSQDHDLVLRMCERAKKIVHIPEVLYYWRVHEQSVAWNISAKTYAVDAGIRAVQEHLKRKEMQGKVESTIEGIPRYRILPEKTYTPLISMIIRTEKINEALEFLWTLDSSINYPQIEYLLPETLKEEIETEFRTQHPVWYLSSFTASQISKTARGEFYLFLHTGILEMSDDWLPELLVWLQEKDVACCGGKIMQKDGTMVQAGIVLRSGKVWYPYRGMPFNTEGYEAELTHTRSVTALGGEIGLIKRSVFQEICRKENEEVSLEELSFRASLQGYCNLWTPHCCFIVKEEKKDAFLDLRLEEEWKRAKRQDDCFYNPKRIKEDKVKSFKILRQTGISQKSHPKLQHYRELFWKTKRSLFTEGFMATRQKIKNYRVLHKNMPTAVPTAASYRQGSRNFMDVLFIVGCDNSVPHPTRYRVIHQKEQLIAGDIVGDDIFYTNLSLDLVKFYRTFVFFRCPHTQVVEKFIQEAKKRNKKVLFDIDDLVIDTNYTNQIPYVRELPLEEKKIYDDGVTRMGKTLCLCDGAITTTERLAEELSHYVPEVFINRNTASELMILRSEEAYQLKQKGKLEQSIPFLDKTRVNKFTKQEIRLGYFSGSITHNNDFLLIVPALLRLFQKYSNLSLSVVGELEIPKAFQPYRERILGLPFVDWQQLPSLICFVDINLAPLEKTIFNEAKSENKWIEAALVRVPTVASKVGAFEVMITQGETGLVCSNVKEWYQALDRLISDADYRKKLAENAYEYVIKQCTTISAANRIVEYMIRKTRKNMAMVLPSTQISGGILVALKHCEIMYRQGYDVVIIASNPTADSIRYQEIDFPVLSLEETKLFGRFDLMVATMWLTVDYVLRYPAVKKRCYLVQNYEIDFYERTKFERIQASQTYYKEEINYITISKWCKSWLEHDFHRIVSYVPNGIDPMVFSPIKRKMTGKIRVLIEGDSMSIYKNVDESFQITNRLDRNRFEIWYLSYHGLPKKDYQYDRFFHKVAYEKMPYLYQQCDILLKSSYLESFSYPPLEMMATGGYVVVVPNEGNQEYLKDNENCLFYQRGKIKEAIQAIEQICTDQNLRERLYQNGIKTAKERDWKRIESQIRSLYES